MKITVNFIGSISTSRSNPLLRWKSSDHVPQTYTLVYDGMIENAFTTIQYEIYKQTSENKRLRTNGTTVFTFSDADALIETVIKETLGFLISETSDDVLVINRNGTTLYLTLPTIIISREICKSVLDVVKCLYNMSKFHLRHTIEKTKRKRAKTKFKIWIRNMTTHYPNLFSKNSISPFFRLMHTRKKLKSSAVLWDSWKFATRIPVDPYTTGSSGNTSISFDDAVRLVRL